MGRIGVVESTLSDAKSVLVLEICSISTTPIACPHKHHFNNVVPSHFIDWYRLLGVAEDAGLELIKRRYHKLALQLHPDKNKHPKAEVAFKLVSEAYTCLSDNVRRRAFNSERWKHFCIECNRIPYLSAANSRLSSKLKLPQDAAAATTNWSRSSRVAQDLKEIRDRFKEEIRVIENCLRVNSLSKKESPLFKPSSSNNVFQSEIKHMGSLSQSQNQRERESPVFEPSDYVFQGYPHLRSQIYRKPDDSSWELRGRRGSVDGRRKNSSNNYHHNSPIFENASEHAATTTGMFMGMLKSKSVCIHS